MIQERHYPIIGTFFFLSLGIVGLMCAWYFTEETLSGARNMDPVVFISRLGFAGWGGGVSMIGVAAGAGLVDVLGWERLRKPVHVFFFGGALLMFLLPIPATFLAARHLERAGYVSCGSPSGFKLSRLSYALDANDCPRD